MSFQFSRIFYLSDVERFSWCGIFYSLAGYGWFWLWILFLKDPVFLVMGSSYLVKILTYRIFLMDHLLSLFMLLVSYCILVGSYCLLCWWSVGAWILQGLYVFHLQFSLIGIGALLLLCGCFFGWSSWFDLYWILGFF